MQWVIIILLSKIFISKWEINDNDAGIDFNFWRKMSETLHHLNCNMFAVFYNRTEILKGEYP